MSDGESASSVVSEASVDSAVDADDAGVRVRFTLSNEGVFKVRVRPANGGERPRRAPRS
jgi:hypothetical protein